ncbi:MAG: hypothetical protein H6742_04910 [Alphaproteobacteria bacterium]|nr:hypothetical protein [Alphaproteobacteria bacterium]
MPANSTGRGAGRSFTMSRAIWAASMLSALAAMGAGWLLTSETFERSLERSVAQQVRSQASMAAAALVDADDAGLERLRSAAELRHVSVWGDHQRESGAPASAPLVELAAAARQGRSTVAWASDDEDDLAPVAAACAPLPVSGSSEVVCVEADASSLVAADDIETTLAGIAALVMAVAAVASGALASATSRPLRTLARQLDDATPGSPPERISVAGPAEVRHVGRAAAALLSAVQTRDQRLQLAHEAQLAQVSAMAAAVAHEVRNPLNGIALAIQTLERASGDDAARTRGRAIALVDELDAIVERFLDLSRPPEPVFRPVSTDVLRERLELEAKSSGLLLSLTGPTAEVTWTTDPDLVLQAFRNLFRNAREAGAGSVFVQIETAGQVVATVHDDGPGIPGERAERVFDWFHTSRANGSGLGLGAARRALRAVGGELELVAPARAGFRAQLGRLDP